MAKRPTSNRKPRASRKPKKASSSGKKRTGGTGSKSNAWRAYVGSSGGWDSIPD